MGVLFLLLGCRQAGIFGHDIMNDGMKPEWHLESAEGVSMK